MYNINCSITTKDSDMNYDIHYQLSTSDTTAYVALLRKVIEMLEGVAENIEVVKN